MARTLVTGRESMTSKARVQAFFRGEETDRIPINMAQNPLIRKRVMAYAGAEDEAQLRQALGIDFMGVGARYKGPSLFEPVDRQVNPIYGWRTRWVEHGIGGSQENLRRTAGLPRLYLLHGGAQLWHA